MAILQRLLARIPGFRRSSHDVDAQVPDEIFHKEERISAKIGDLEHDYDSVLQWRAQNRNGILKLNRALKRISFRNLPMEDRILTDLRTYQHNLKDLRRYENLLRRQVADLIQIMHLLKDLINLEYYDILYDLRRPLSAFEHFFEHLREAMETLKDQGNTQNASTMKRIREILENINRSYQKLVQHTMKFLEEDLRYYKSIGLDFHGFDESKETDVPLQAHLRERGRAKQQINGKTQYIVAQIELLRKQLASLQDASSTNHGTRGEIIYTAISRFAGQFKGLGEYCTKRIEISDAVIIEAIVLQKEKHAALRKLNEEVAIFHRELAADHREISDNDAAPKWKTERLTKRVELFQKASADFEAELEKLEHDFHTQFEAVESDELKTLQEETSEAARDEGKVARFGGRFAVAMTTAAAALAIVVIVARNDQTPVPTQDARPGIERAYTVPKSANPEITQHPTETKTETPSQDDETHPDPTPNPDPNSFTLGNTLVHIDTYGAIGNNLVYFNMHDDENTSVDATKRVIDQRGGTLVELKHNGGRFITFTLKDKQYKFDPNRIFTETGISHTLQKYGPYSSEAHAAVRNFASHLLNHPALHGATTIVAVHNNTEHRYSAKSYLSELRQDAKDVHLQSGTDPDDFAFVTDPVLFLYFQRHGFNVVLQDNTNATDDGSLSIYCAHNGIRYVNIEAQHKHSSQQQVLLAAMNDALNDQEAVKVPFSEQNVTSADIAKLSPIIPKLYQTSEDKERHHLVVDGEQQAVFLIHRGEPIGKFRTSTASAGFGEKQDSWKTPRGLLQVHKVIGRGMPRGTQFVARKAVYDGSNPRVRTIHQAAYDSEEDVIASRIIWLEGLERRNRNTLGRHIYLHGTNEEGLLSRPVSHGCPRLSNDVVIQLADRYIDAGSKVFVIEGATSPQPTFRTASHNTTVNPIVNSFINTLYREPGDQHRYHLLVDGQTQRVHIVYDKKIVRTVSTSTGKYGWGSRKGSGRTPEGLFKVTQVVGNNMPVGTVIKHGADVTEGGRPKVVPVRGNTGKAVMTTRVVYINGLEPGNRNSMSRGVRLHGTNKEEKLGQQDSGGCIRVDNETIIELADDLLSKGSSVYVIGNNKIAALEHEDSRDELLGR